MKLEQKLAKFHKLYVQMHMFQIKYLFAGQIFSKVCSLASNWQ